MNPNEMTQLALRTAVNSAKRNINAGDDNAHEAIEQSALEKATSFVTANGTVSAIASQMASQEMAIHAAIACVKIAYDAVVDQIRTTQEKRIAFDKERQAGFASFIIPTNIEETRLTQEEHAVKAFIELANRTPILANYLGIHKGEIEGLEKSKYYSVMPFFRMSDHLPEPIASPKSLDKARIIINLFLKAQLPKAISDIDLDFQSDTKVGAIFSSTLEGHNYLNAIRAPRFIMFALSNLLWNIQHPVDPKSGFPISIKESIDLCRQVEIFINTLLDKDAPPFIDRISTKANNLLSFIRKIEYHTKSLHSGYKNEQLHEMNIEDVTNSAHRALRVIDKSVLKLIYKRHNPKTGREEPDEQAAQDIAYIMTYLNQLIYFNPELVSIFDAFIQEVPERERAYLNPKATTVIDILIIFCHLVWSARGKLIDKIKESTLGSAEEFARVLEHELHDKYIKPIKQVVKKVIGATFFHRRHNEVAYHNAKRLVPLFTLVLEDYRVDVDNPNASEHSAFSNGQYRTGSQQVQQINRCAQEGSGYYIWSIAPFFAVGPEVGRQLDDLPKKQYKMTQMTKLMDNIADLITSYQSFLQYPSFQSFLLKVLRKIKEEFATVDHEVDAVDQYLSRDEHIDRSLSGILRPMLDELEVSLECFAKAAENFERVVSAPDFTEQQRLLLATKIDTIVSQFHTLFEEDTDINVLRELSAAARLPIMQLSGSTYPSIRLPSTRITPAPQSRFSPQSRPSSIRSPLPTSPLTAEIIDDATPTSDAATPTAAETRSATTESQASPLFMDARQVIAFRKVVESCYHAQSLLSRFSKKGDMLLDLINRLDNQANFTQKQLQHALYELCRIVSCYRPTHFFQAHYAETRSAQMLFSAIRNPEINAILPLAQLFFNQAPPSPLSRLTTIDLLDRMIALKRSQSWESDVPHLRPIMLSP